MTLARGPAVLDSAPLRRGDDRACHPSSFRRRDFRSASQTAAPAVVSRRSMVGMAYAAVPLYDWFCRATGFNGTAQVSTAAPGTFSTARSPSDSTPTSGGGLPWRFEPEQGIEVGGEDRRGRHGGTTRVINPVGARDHGRRCGLQRLAAHPHRFVTSTRSITNCFTDQTPQGRVRSASLQSYSTSTRRFSLKEMTTAPICPPSPFRTASIRSARFWPPQPDAARG